ncbi:hypothetical protein GCM10028801_33370 [Nocardioides maradonensis]
MVAGLAGSVVALASARGVFGGRPVAVALSGLLVVAGLGAAVWALRAVDRVHRHELAELTDRDGADGLPFGAFRRGDRIGLDASDVWLLLASILAVLGAFVLLTGLTDREMNRAAALLLPLVGFLPAAACAWCGSGTPYWLTEDRVIVRGPFRRHVRYDDVERFRVSGTAIELQASVERPMRWGRLGLTMRLMLVAVDAPELLALLAERCPSAHVIGAAQSP